MKKTTLIAAICTITILATPIKSFARDNSGAIIGSVVGALVGTAASNDGYEAASIVPITTAVGGLIGTAIDADNDHHHYKHRPSRHYHHYKRPPHRSHKIHSKHYNRPKPKNHHRKSHHRGRR